MRTKRKKLVLQHDTEIKTLRSRIEGLESCRQKTDEKVSCLTKSYKYRVVQDGDVWKAYLIEHKTLSFSFSTYEVPGKAFFGATKASAVKRMKAELLVGTTPSFVEHADTLVDSTGLVARVPIRKNKR